MNNAWRRSSRGTRERSSPVIIPIKKRNRHFTDFADGVGISANTRRGAYFNIKIVLRGASMPLSGRFKDKWIALAIAHAIQLKN